MNSFRNNIKFVFPILKPLIFPFILSFIMIFLISGKSSSTFGITIILLCFWGVIFYLISSRQIKVLQNLRSVLTSIDSNQFSTFNNINIDKSLIPLRRELKNYYELAAIKFDFENRRTLEIERIQAVINAIRMNTITSSEEINLGVELNELEENIKSMYIKTQNDISSMKKLAKARTEFLGNVSHELRTPIFAMQGFLETLLNGAIDDENVNRKFVQKAFNHSRNLNSLLNDLIDISMIESGEMTLVFTEFSAKEFFESVHSEFLERAEDKGLNFILSPIKNDMKLYGDKSKLRQVMSNLITNAIKYTEEGKIEIRVTKVTGGKQILISDSGLGIPDDSVNRIFERFYRVDKARSRSIGGTGLGLAIVKHIIEAHNSEIKVASDLGNGSEFYFILYDS